MKRSTDLQDPHDSTKKTKPSTSETTISPFEETPSIEKPKEVETLENSEDNPSTTSASVISPKQGNKDENSERSNGCQGRQADSNKEIPPLGTKDDKSNIKISNRMEKIATTTMPRGCGFGSNNFAFFNGFAVPLQNVGPSLPTPTNVVFRPQFAYQMNGISFPRPQSIRKQQEIQSTVAASIIRNSERNHHVINPTASRSHYNAKNARTGLATTSFPFSQPWPTQAIVNLNQIAAPENPIQSSSQFTKNDSMSNRTTNSYDFEGESAWKRIFQCCHCNSTNVREILIRSHNYCCTQHHNVGDGLATAASLKIAAESGDKCNYRGGVKRKRGYGIQDDYVLDGKFVDAEGNQSTDNEFENGNENSSSPPLKKRLTFNSIFPQRKRDGIYSFGDKRFASRETPVVNSFRLENSTSNSSKVFNFPFGGNSSSSSNIESSLSSLRKISRPITACNTECAQGCSKFESGSESKKSQDSHLKLCSNRNSNRNTINFSNLAFQNSPIRFETFKNRKYRIGNDNKKEMKRRHEEKLSPLNTSMSSVQLSSTATKTTTTTKSAASSSCKLSTSSFNVGVPHHNPFVKNSPMGVPTVLPTASTSFTPSINVPYNVHGISSSSIHTNNNSPFSFGSNSNMNSNSIVMGPEQQQRESSVEPILFLNGNPLNGYSSTLGPHNITPISNNYQTTVGQTCQASIPTLSIPQRFSQFSIMNQTIPNTFNFSGASRGGTQSQQSGVNNLFQFQGQGDSQDLGTGMVPFRYPFRARRIKKGIRRLKRK